LLALDIYLPIKNRELTALGQRARQRRFMREKLRLGLTSVVLPLKEGGLRFIPGFLRSVAGLQQFVCSTKVDFGKLELVLRTCNGRLHRDDLGLRIVHRGFCGFFRRVPLRD
jgi:hypothetical protein